MEPPLRQSSQLLPNELWFLVNDFLPVPDQNRIAQVTKHLRGLLLARLVRADIQAHGSMMLHWAVEKNEPNTLKLALQYGANPLEFCLAEYRDLHFVAQPWNDCTDPNALPSSCATLHYALKGFYNKAPGANSGRLCTSALNCALWNNRVELLKLLIAAIPESCNLNELPTECKHGTVYSHAPLLHIALRVYTDIKYPPVSQYIPPWKSHLLQNHTPERALECARLLLEAGADANQVWPRHRGQVTPLHLVNDAEGGGLLLQHNADLMHAVDVSCTTTPFHNAVASRSVNYLDTLLAIYLAKTSEYRTIQLASTLLGVVVDKRNRALDPADFVGRKAIAKLLLQYGADANYLYPLSTGPLSKGCCIDFAVIQRDEQFLEFLIAECGARIDENTLFTAASNGYRDTLALLMGAAVYGIGDVVIQRKWEQYINDEMINTLMSLLDGGARMDMIISWWLEYMGVKDEEMERLEKEKIKLEEELILGYRDAMKNEGAQLEEISEMEILKYAREWKRERENRVDADANEDGDTQ